MKIQQTVFIGAIFSLFCSPTLAKKKILPKHLQKAYVIQKDAIVYTRPDFDAAQVLRIPSGSMVTISKKIYRPKTSFGTFYHIYLNKPKKIKAYISEIDVVPRYIRSGSTHKINPSFNEVKKNLSRLDDMQFNSEPEAGINLNSTPTSQLMLFGLVTDYLWIENLHYPGTRGHWFFNLKYSQPDFPLPPLGAHISLGFSTKPPIINAQLQRRGFYIMGNILLTMALIESSHFLFQLGGGFVLKWKQALPAPLPPENPHHLSIGIVGLGSFTIRITERFYLLLEGKLQKDFAEYKMIPGVGGGIMVAI